MKTLHPLCALLIPLALAACASTTVYQPLKNGVGYSDQKLENNRYRVSYAGSSSTPKQTVENYLLYRAAEVTLSNGFDYFVMGEHSTERDTRYEHTLSGFGGLGRYSWSPYYRAGIGVSTSTPSTEYEAQAMIVMHSGKKPAGDSKAFDAREVKANLEPAIERAPAAG